MSTTPCSLIHLIFCMFSAYHYSDKQCKQTLYSAQFTQLYSFLFDIVFVCLILYFKTPFTLCDLKSQAESVQLCQRFKMVWKSLGNVSCVFGYHFSSKAPQMLCNSVMIVVRQTAPLKIIWRVSSEYADLIRHAESRDNYSLKLL